jgi:hypothetical protein
MTRAMWVVVLLAGVAWADIAPSDVSGCNGKSAGDSCKRDDGSAGSCAKSTCSRNDYSNGPPPTQVSYECLLCGAAASPPPEKKQSCSMMPAEAMGLLALVFLRRSRARSRSCVAPG